MTTLNETLNPINPEERVKINQNWRRIMERFSSLQNQISILSGETSVEDILNELNSAISSANTTVQGLVDDTNQSIANVNQKINEVDGKLVELQTAIDNANLATDATNSAINDARQAIADINAYFQNFRFVGEYNATTTYFNFNFVRYQKSTFVSLKENLGLIPNDDGINWRLVAAAGMDGSGTVASVNGKSPDDNGEITLTSIDVGSASIEQITETNGNLLTLQQQVNAHLDNTRQFVEFTKTSLQMLSSGTTMITFDTIANGNNASFCTLQSGIPTITKAGTYLVSFYINKNDITLDNIEVRINSQSPLSVNKDFKGSTQVNAVLNLSENDLVNVNVYNPTAGVFSINGYGSNGTIVRLS